MRALIAREPITLYSNGAATRAFCYVADAVTAMFAVLTDNNTAGEIYNVGNDKTEITISDLANLAVSVGHEILENCDSRVEFGASDDDAYTIHSPIRRCPDLTKIRESVGYEPQTNLRQGLSRTLHSYTASEQMIPESTLDD